MNELVKEGKSIIMISSEMTEILRMSDRVIVMCEGRKTAEIDIAEGPRRTSCMRQRLEIRRRRDDKGK